MADFAKALARPAPYITNYFKHDFGVQSDFDKIRGTSLVRGAHDTAKLAGFLDIFIKKYVQCYGCLNPETDILISRTQVVSLKCAACGFVSDVGMRDKIIKNRPDNKVGKDKKLRSAEKECLKEGVAADGRQKKLKKDEKKKGGSSKGSTADHSTSPTQNQHVAIGVDANEDSDNDDDVQWQTDTSLEAAKQHMQEQLTAATAGMVMLSTDEPGKKKQALLTTNRSAQRHGSSDDKQTNKTIVDTNSYGELVEQIRVNLGNAATADQLRGVLSSSTLPSQDVMNSLLV